MRMAADQSLAACAKALDLALAADDPWGQAEAHRLLSLWHARYGEDDEAIQHGRMAVSLFDQSGDRRKSADARFNLCAEVSFDEAVGLVESARDLYAELGLRQDAADCEWRLGGLYEDNEQLLEARDQLLLSLKGFVAERAWEGVVRAARAVNRVLRTLGDLQSARDILGQTSAQLESLDSRAWPDVIARADMGILLLWAAMPVEALRHLTPAGSFLLEHAFDEGIGTELHRTWSESDWLDLTSGVLTCEVEALAQVGRIEEGRAAARRAQDWASSHAVDIDDALTIGRALGLLTAGRGSQAAELLLPLREKLIEIAPEERGLGYDRILGIVEQNLAACYAMQGSAEDALAACNRAQALLDGPEAGESQAAIAYVRGLVARDTGGPGGELGHMQALIEGLVDMGALARAATMRANLASLLIEDDCFGEACIQSARASEDAAMLGLVSVRLTADSVHALADFLNVIEEEDDDDLMQEKVERCLDQAIPAALGLGALRLTVRDVQVRMRLTTEFAQAADRAAWIAQFSEGGRALVELAETVRMFGVIHRREPMSTSSAALAPRLVGRPALAPDSGGEEATPDEMAAHLLGGVGSLTELAGDIALSAPPMLVMPWGTIALARYHDLAKQRYGVRMACDQTLRLGGAV